MPPIPIYAHSPINAAKAEDAPKAATGQNSAASEKTPIITAAPDLNQAHGYRPVPAVTGAGPPGPTSVSRPSAYTPAQPTATATRAANSYDNNQGPPPPQPGAVPTPYGGPPTATSTLPPPPKVGEKYQPPQQTQTPTASMPYPAQMAVPPPTMPHGQRGTASAVAPGYAPQAVNLTGSAGAAAGGGSNLSHPPGYHQNVNAADMNSNQRAAHQANVSGSGLGLGGGAGMGGGGSGPAGDEGVWDSAVKLVQAAGEKLSAAESEVWRRISKD